VNVFENRALGRIFGSKKQELAAGWRNLPNEELHNFHPSPDILG
jgi:hypothetical protein